MEGGRGSDVVGDWLASLTNREQRVVLLIVVIHLLVGFGATLANGTRAHKRDRTFSQ